MWIVLAVALLPVVVLFGYIWLKDRRQPEPMKWLLKALFYGLLSTALVIMVVGPLPEIEVTDPVSAFLKAFLTAAMPEEAAKLLMLYILLKKNPFFDEQLDGIVYAACVALGFAGTENIMYLLGGLSDGSWVTMGISRAIFAVPGHFFFGTLMGYFFARAWFGNPAHKTRNMFLAWFVPMLAHGIYDGILFTMPTMPEWVAGVLLIVFIGGFIVLRKQGVRVITVLQTEDEILQTIDKTEDTNEKDCN